MNAWWALFRHEWRILLRAKVVPFAMVAFFCMHAVVFWFSLGDFEVAQQRALNTKDPSLIAMLDLNDAIVASVLLAAQITLLLVMPLLTWRTFDRSGSSSLKLVMLSPASSLTVVLAKAAAVLSIVLLLTLSLAVFPALLAVYGTAVISGDGLVDLGRTISGLLAVLLTGSLYASIGLVVAVHTTRSVSAALITAMVLLALWFAGSVAPSVNSAAGALLYWLSPTSHLERLVRGQLMAADVGYFASSMALLLALAMRLLAAQRRA